MSAAIIPFPRIRKQSFVARHARRMVGVPHETAEKHLAYLLQLQRQVMSKRGIDSGLIERELTDLELAIRNEVWHIVMSDGWAT